MFCNHTKFIWRNAYGNVPPPKANVIPIIMSCVCDIFNVTKGELLSKTHKRIVVDAKKATLVLIKRYSKKPITLHQIGRVFDYHHTTVIHSLNSYQNLLDTDIGQLKIFKILTEKLDNIFGLNN
jgi:chromosomal replication initiation ATPase DnaA